MSRDVVYSTSWFDVIAKKISVEEEPYYSLRLRDYVAIFAVTEEKEVVLVRQYRPAVEKYTIELPSGLAEESEPPEETARRELWEETGYRARQVDLVDCLYPDTGRLGNRVWYCYMPEVRLDREAFVPEEGVETILCGVHDLKELMLNGEFNHAIHVAVIGMLMVKGKFNFD